MCISQMWLYEETHKMFHLTCHWLCYFRDLDVVSIKLLIFILVWNFTATSSSSRSTTVPSSSYFINTGYFISLSIFGFFCFLFFITVFRILFKACNLIHGKLPIWDSRWIRRRRRRKCYDFVLFDFISWLIWFSNCPIRAHSLDWAPVAFDKITACVSNGCAAAKWCIQIQSKADLNCLIWNQHYKNERSYFCHLVFLTSIHIHSSTEQCFQSS